MEARQLGSGIPVKGQKHVTWDQRRSQPSIVLGWASPDNKYKEAGSSSQKMKEDWSGQSSRWSQRKRGEYTGRQEQIIKGSHWLEWGGCILLYWLWEVTKEIRARNRCQLCFPADRLPPWCTLSTVSTRNQSLVGTPKVQVSKFLYPQTCFTNILCTLRMSEARASHPFLMSIFTLRPALPVRYNLTDDPPLRVFGKNFMNSLTEAEYRWETVKHNWVIFLPSAEFTEALPSSYCLMLWQGREGKN